MIKLPFKKYRFTLHPITPIHVGSGINAEPYEYKLFDEEEGCFLAMLDVNKVIASLKGNSKSKFDNYLNSGDFVGLRNFMSEIANIESHSQYEIEVPNSIQQQLRDISEKQNRKGEIGLFTRIPNGGAPYIPGSSIKGSIRTALLNKWASEFKNKEELKNFADSSANDRSSAKFEGMLMGNIRCNQIDRRSTNYSLDIHADPFYKLSIPDIALEMESTYITRVEVVRTKTSTAKKGSGDTKGILIFREVVISAANGFDDSYSCVVRFADRPEFDKKLKVTKRITPYEICEACNTFYSQNLVAELDKYEVNKDCQEVLNSYRSTIDKSESTRALIRIGRHSHFESVTVTQFARKPQKGFGKSRTYTRGNVPMGWAMIEFSEV